MAYTPPTYTPSGSLFGSTPAATPYTYGNLGKLLVLITYGEVQVILI